jgi:thiol-disulfide isomerase/thioredoxin
MLARLLVAALVLGASFAAYGAWKRPPRRVSAGRSGAVDLEELGVHGPAIVQFTAPYCAPCRAAAPLLERAAGHAGLAFEQVDVEERPDVAHRYGIRTVPTILVADRSGQVLASWTRLPMDSDLAEATARARSLG